MGGKNRSRTSRRATPAAAQALHDERHAESRRYVAVPQSGAPPHACTARWCRAAGRGRGPAVRSAPGLQAAHVVERLQRALLAGGTPLERQALIHQEHDPVVSQPHAHHVDARRRREKPPALARPAVRDERPPTRHSTMPGTQMCKGAAPPSPHPPSDTGRSSLFPSPGLPRPSHAPGTVHACATQAPGLLRQQVHIKPPVPQN